MILGPGMLEKCKLQTSVKSEKITPKSISNQTSDGLTNTIPEYVGFPRETVKAFHKIDLSQYPIYYEWTILQYYALTTREVTLISAVKQIYNVPLSMKKLPVNLNSVKALIVSFQ